MNVRTTVRHAMAALILTSGLQAQATGISLSFDTIAQGTTVGGSAPWLAVSIQDTTTVGTVQITVNSLLNNTISPPQTLTGIWLNLSSAVSSGLGSLVLSGGSGTGQLPSDFASGSIYTPTQSTTPAGATGANVAKYNIYLKFPNSGSGTSFQDHQYETFSLSGTGLTATAFATLAGQTAAGLPSPDYYAMAALTNAGGSTGSGIAYIGARTWSPVPVPAALLLMLSGAGLLGGVLRRRA